MSSFGKFMLGAVVGGVLGGVIGVLMAPRPGHETRQIMREEMNRRYTDSVDTVKGEVERVRGEVDRSVNAVKGRYTESVDDLKHLAAEWRERAAKLGETFERSGEEALEHLTGAGEKA